MSFIVAKYPIINILITWLEGWPDQSLARIVWDPCCSGLPLKSYWLILNVHLFIDMSDWVFTNIFQLLGWFSTFLTIVETHLSRHRTDTGYHWLPSQWETSPCSAWFQYRDLHQSSKTYSSIYNEPHHTTVGWKEIKINHFSKRNYPYVARSNRRNHEDHNFLCLAGIPELSSRRDFPSYYKHWPCWDWSIISRTGTFPSTKTTAETVYCVLWWLRELRRNTTFDKLNKFL